MDEISSLNYAIEISDIEKVKNLLQKRPKLAFAILGGTPLVVKALDKPRILKVFLQYIDPNIEINDKETILFIAVKHANVQAVKLLLEANANPNYPKTNLPLKYAIRNNLGDIADMLILHGADPSIRDSTGLNAYDICKRNTTSLCKKLFTNFTIGNNKGFSGLTSLDNQESATPINSDEE